LKSDSGLLGLLLPLLLHAFKVQNHSQPKNAAIGICFGVAGGAVTLGGC
jgi:hypothetical protein